MDESPSKEESWNFTQVKVSKLKHLWTIDKFSFVTESEKVLTSSVLSPKPDDTTKWYMFVYPKGLLEDDLGTYVSLYIKLVSSERPKVRAKFKFALLNHKGEESKGMECQRVYTFVPGKDWGFKRFIRRDYLQNENNGLLVSDTLTISCEVQVADESLTNDALPRTIMSKMPYYNIPYKRKSSRKNSMRVKCYITTPACKEVRLFKLDPSNNNVYNDLINKICESYDRHVELMTEDVTLKWTDEEGDEIVVSSNGELQAALEETKNPTLKMSVTVKGNVDDYAWDCYPEPLQKHKKPCRGLSNTARRQEDVVPCVSCEGTMGNQEVQSSDSSESSGRCSWCIRNDFHPQDLKIFNTMFCNRQEQKEDSGSFSERPAPSSTSSSSSLMSEYIKQEITKMRLKKCEPSTTDEELITLENKTAACTLQAKNMGDDDVDDVDDNLTGINTLGTKNDNVSSIAITDGEAKEVITEVVEVIQIADSIDESTLKEPESASKEHKSVPSFVEPMKSSGDAMKGAIAAKDDVVIDMDHADVPVVSANASETTFSENDDFVMCSEDPVIENQCDNPPELVPISTFVPPFPASSSSNTTSTPSTATASASNTTSTISNTKALVTTLKLPNSVHAALVCMIDMGYTNHGEWLAKLLLNKKGDINTVIDILNSNEKKLESINVFHGKWNRGIL